MYQDPPEFWGKAALRLAWSVPSIMAVADVAIVGGGLSGLTAAYRITSLFPSVIVVVLEARDRIGGRTANAPGTALDVGGAWLWPGANPHLERLASDVGVQTFPQPGDDRQLMDIYEQHGRVQTGQGGDDSKVRFVGGAWALCDELSKKLPEGSVRTGIVVAGIESTGDGVLVLGRSQEVITRARAVIVAIPQKLAAQLKFSPSLPADHLALMKKTHTWMSDTGKIVVEYARPFWRDKGLSGSGISQSGPLIQLYDGSALGTTNAPAICGFLFGRHAHELRKHRATPAEVEKKVLHQLVQLFGEEAGSPLKVIFCVRSLWVHTAQVHRHVWLDDEFTTNNVDPMEPPGSHPTPNPKLSEARGPVLFAGAETALRNCGLLDGAVEAGERAARQVAQFLQS